MNNIISASLTKMATAVDPITPADGSPTMQSSQDALSQMGPPTTTAPTLQIKSPEDAIDYVTVSDPVIHADGMNKYTSYRVDCRPPIVNPNQQSPPNATIEKRGGGATTDLKFL